MNTTTAKFCANCGQAASSAAKFCGHCGTPVAETPGSENTAKASSSPVSLTLIVVIVMGLIVAGVFATIMASDFANANDPSADHGPSPEDKLIAKAESDVRDQLKDPTSAQFKDVGTSVSGNCAYGQVLAKNAFGAFAGYEGFYWKKGYVHFENDMGFLKYSDAKVACIQSSVDALAAKLDDKPK